MRGFFLKTKPKGSALTVVIVFTVIVVLLGAYILTFAVNQKMVMDKSSKGRIVPYYRSKAGIVNANWRIKANDKNTLTGYIAASDSWDYYLDIETDTISLAPPPAAADVHIVIDAPATTGPTIGLRAIKSTGLDK